VNGKRPECLNTALKKRPERPNNAFKKRHEGPNNAYFIPTQLVHFDAVHLPATRLVPNAKSLFIRHNSQMEMLLRLAAERYVVAFKVAFNSKSESE
jgi:hypothetical protein